MNSNRVLGNSLDRARASEPSSARAFAGRVAAWTLLVGAAVVGACRSSGAEPSAESLSREGTELLAELIARTVSDVERAEHARALIAAYQQDELAFFERLGARQDELHSLNARHDASREEFEQLFAGLNAERRAFRKRSVETLTGLKQHLEADEWTVVFEGLEDQDAKWEELAQ